VPTTNSRAWDLLRRILEEKPWIKNHLSFDLVDWVTDGSRQVVRVDRKIDIDMVEKEVLEFKTRMELDDQEVELEAETWQALGWTKWKREWTPRPIGVL
jgi:hypothetical protein